MKSALATIGALFVIAALAGQLPGMQFALFVGPDEGYIRFLLQESSRIHVTEPTT